MVKRTAQSALAIGMAIAATLLALGTTPAQAATSAAAPKVGSCHAITLKRAGGYADPSKAVSCSKRHTAITIGVVTLTTPLLSLDQDQRTVAEGEACSRVYLAKLGRSVARRATSAYSFVFFQPTAAQLQAGAQWVRCDLVEYAGRKLLSLPAHLRHPILPAHQTDGTERCLTGAHYLTPCSTTHAYRPIDVIRFKPVATYPSHADFVSAGSELCPSKARYYTWTNDWAWADGDRALVCYARTTK